MIMLDPSVSRCEVWFSDGNMQSLNGTPEGICNKIKDYVIEVWFNSIGEKHIRQIQEVYIDKMGIGMLYYQLLNGMNVKVKSVSYEKRIKENY